MSPYNAYEIVADLSSGDDTRVRRATDAIVWLSPASEVDEFAFITALESTDDQTVYWAGVALKLLGPRGAAAIPHLLALLRREQIHLRQTAVKALAGVGPHHPDARAAVFAAFGDEHAFIRREAVAAGITLPDLTEEDLAAIAGMATDPDEEVRNIALRSIASKN